MDCLHGKSDDNYTVSMVRVMTCTYRFHGESDDIQVVLVGGPVEDGIGAPVLTVDTAWFVLQTRLYHTGSGQNMTGRLVHYLYIMCMLLQHGMCSPSLYSLIPKPYVHT